MTIRVLSARHHADAVISLNFSNTPTERQHPEAVAGERGFSKTRNLPLT
jgi:hypothetical protein